MKVELSHNRQFNNNETNKQNIIRNDKPSFGNVGDVITNALIASDKSPMIGVSIIDLCSMIGPRSIVDATRNGFAATETFLRESAGLIINCLIPSFVVYAMGKLFEKKVMGSEFAKFEPSKFWANQKTNEMLSTAWLSTKDISKPDRMKAFVTTVLDNTEGLAGQSSELTKTGLSIKDGWVQIKNLPNKDAIYTNIANAITNNDEKLLANTTSELIKNLHASKTLRLIKDTPFASLEGVKKIGVDTGVESLLKDMKNLGGAFSKMSDAAVPGFSKKLTKLINTKSFTGLAVVVAAGASFQFFNRMLTKMRTGSNDFVGEKDYLKRIKEGINKDKKEIQDKENTKLNLHKFLGTLGMGLLALASFGKKPTINMFQFNGMFPTLNQCRAISAVTYSGRIISSANDNELKETALRDTCTFVNLYYLGDYISKAFATFKEKFGGMKGELLNETQKLKPNANIFDKFWHWFKHTELKSFDELANNPAVKKNRAFAQASGLLYSCIVLGLIVPLYNKHRTNKKALIRQQMVDTIEHSKQATNFDKKNLFTNFFANIPSAS